MNTIDIANDIASDSAGFAGRPARSLGWPDRARVSSLCLLSTVGFLGTLVVSGVPAVANVSENAVPSGAADLESLDDAADAIAESERARARQRLLDYLERLRSRPEEPVPTASFPSFGSDVFDAQLAGYLAYVNAVGTPDILIVGSSRALQGIDPAELQAQLAAQGYPGLKVYNFSVNGATAQVVNFVLGDLLPGELPGVVVWGDGSRAFNDGRRDRTWETITVSPGYQAVLRGEKPVLESVASTEVTFLSASGTVVSYSVESSGVSDHAVGDHAVGDHAVGLLAPSIDTVPVEEAAPLQIAERETAPVETEAVAIEETEPPSSATLAGTRLNGLILNGLGFSAVSDRFDPVRYYQQFPRVSGQYDGAYSPFALQGAQTVALGQAANAVRRQNSQLIFVNLPLSDSYLDDFRLYYEDRFQQFLQAEGDRYGFAVVDFLQSWQGQPDLFADPSHINQHGAAAIAAQLAFEPTLLLALRARE